MGRSKQSHQAPQHESGPGWKPQTGEFSAFLISLAVHLCVLIALGMFPVALHDQPDISLVSTASAVRPDELEVPEEFRFSLEPAEEVGANSVQGEFLALSMAPVVSEIAAIPNHLQMLSSDVEHPQIQLNNLVSIPTGLRYNENLAVKGAAGEGTTGAVGAIDRITHEILLSLEERKTLVVWLFDQTASLIPQRRAIRDRFERIYKELGIIEGTGVESFAKHDDKPLLSAVVSFGKGVQFTTKKPTDDLAELKKAVMETPIDDSGTENTFTAIFEAAKRYAEYRYSTADRPDPERNVMIVIFSDEAGEDTARAEETIKMCRRWAMPVYVVGVPAPFGRATTLMKWVDPNPKYDQRPTWGEVQQGPESLLPERIKLNFSGTREDEEPIDSGFGPYALTRLCVETGGIYFAVHPNRNVGRAVGRWETEAYSAYLKHFFDSEVMRRYRPEYVSVGEYQKRANQNRARAALLQAASASQLGQMRDPRLEFLKADEAAFANALSAAQQQAAALEPKINTLYETLRQGEQDREKETVLRWQAGYDLAMGRTLAVKVRTETYNAMLAAAKRGLKFKNEKDNTWVLRPANEISVGSQYANLAERAKMYLTRVKQDHPGTPWAVLAERELKDPLGWSWEEKFTETAPQRQMVAANVNVPAQPQDDKKKMLPPAKQLRPPPKL